MRSEQLVKELTKEFILMGESGEGCLLFNPEVPETFGVFVFCSSWNFVLWVNSGFFYFKCDWSKQFHIQLKTHVCGLLWQCRNVLDYYPNPSYRNHFKCYISRWGYISNTTSDGSVYEYTEINNERHQQAWSFDPSLTYLLISYSILLEGVTDSLT